MLSNIIGNPRELYAFGVKRSTTNLIADSDFSVSDAEKKTGFLCIFNKTYGGLARKTLMKVAFGCLLDTRSLPMSKPPRPKSQEERDAAKHRMRSLTAWENQRSDSNLLYYTKLRKVNDGDASYFELHLPMLTLNSPAAISAALSALGFVGSVPSEAFDTFSALGEGVHSFPTELCLERAHGIDGAAARAMHECLMRVEIDKGPTSVLSLVFKIPMRTCEYLVNTAWMDIRPVDLYPLFTMWVAGEYVKRFYGKSSFPMSRISATLPVHETADERVDENGLTISMTGSILWIPTPCDDAAKYEQMFSACGVHDDGSFQLLNARSDGRLMKALPVNIPILTDWVNFKFTYSNTSGRPETLPLEHFRECTPGMAMNLLVKPLTEEEMLSLAFWTQPVGMSAMVSMDGDYTPEETEVLRRYFSYTKTMQYNSMVKIAFSVAKSSGYQPRLLDLTDDTSEPLFKPLGKFVRDLYAACKNNIQALNSKYSVKSVIEKMGFLGLIGTYGARISDTSIASSTHKAQYVNQGVDPTWVPPPMPLVSGKMGSEEGGLLPHQARIRNLMRNSPDNAVMAVPAGGGKSPLSITDILQEISMGGTGPFVLMCPSFLVANYVSEIVEFTDGKLNCIPVTSYNIRTTGIPRYEEILSSAPVNSVLVVDFDVTKFRPKTTVYGTSATTIYPVVELIRRFKPTLVILDEVHLLKNAASSRFKAVMSLVADIPKKRIASGTLNPDSPSDLPGEIAFLDPTILGSRNDFNETYGENISGGRVLKWRTKGPNSLADVMGKLKSNVVWCAAQRKEWACALPPRTDTFVPVQLTENQQKVYDAIFDEMVQSIRKQAENDKGAKKLLDKLEGKKATKSEDEDFGGMEDSSEEDDQGGPEDLLDDEGDPGPSLQPYLADIERFVTNPMYHPYARNGFITDKGEHISPLHGDDQKPPKILKLIERMKSQYEVLNPNAPKTLVFVNYNESVKAVYENMPPELQACGLMYSASSKTEMVNRFKKDPKIRWMVGIRQSLETGLNLQVANVLCRLEGVWTPGEQEQGDSRIARPYFGPGGDQRPKLQFDTYVTDRTIDVTKAARLRAKIVAVAKFENTGNPEYEAIEDIPIIPMTLDAITTQNDFNTNLARYRDVMANLNQVIKDEYAEYKTKILAEGGLKFTQVKQAQVPAGCALLARVPYAPGTELYNSTELGYTRVDNFLGMDLSNEKLDDEETTKEEEDNSSNNVTRAQRESIMGLRAHTEQGDGYVIGGGGTPYLKVVAVACDDGTTIRVLSTACFVATRTETNGIDLRNKIAEAAGLEVTGHITVPAASAKLTRVTQKMVREQERRAEEERQAKRKKQVQELKDNQVTVDLQLNLVNGFMQIGFVVKSNPKAAKALEALGFALNPSYYYTQIRNVKQLIGQAEKWADAGFELGSKVDNDTFQILTTEFTTGGLRSHRDYARAIGQAQFRNYMRVEWKPNADKKLLNMFALITDGGLGNQFNLKQADIRSDKKGEKIPPNYGIAYLCLPAGGGHPGSRAAIQSKYSVPGTRWALAQPMLSKFVGTMQGVHKVLEDIRKAGVKVGNIAELNNHAKSVRKITPRTDDDSVVYKDLRDHEEKVNDRAVKQKRADRAPAVTTDSPTREPAVRTKRQG